VLPGLLGRFRAAYPRVAVTLRVESTGTVIDRVLAHDLELGVVGARRPHRALEFEPFLRDRLVLAVPPGHRFAGRTVTLAELTAEPLVVEQEGAGVRRVIEAELRRAGVRLRDLTVTMELGLQESAKAAVEAGFGVSFLSVTAIAKELTLGTLATAEVEGIDPVRDFFSVRAAGRPGGRVTQRFLDWSRARLAEEPAQFGSKAG
jgi:DNA-binding transcriptional LysR family regulator